jgi:hypothetical protein
MFTNPELLFSRLIFVGLIIEAFEIFRLRRAFDEDKIFSQATLSILTGDASWPIKIGATIGRSRTITVAMTGQALAASIVIVEGTGRPAGISAALVCLITNAYLRARRQIGGSGAEQLTFIALVTFGLVLIAGGTDGARRLGDAFISAQVLLAYFASGVSKIASPVWRNGRVMSGILSTEGYGSPRLAKVLKDHAWLDRLLCWTVIVWETIFPLVLFLPRPLMLALLVTGALFHISCAILMGLNRFVWAFCGCYPSVWATAMLLPRTT